MGKMSRQRIRYARSTDGTQLAWAEAGNGPVLVKSANWLTHLEYDVIIDLVRVGWGRSNPAFRQVFTSRFIPSASDEQVAWFNELCRKTTTPETAAKLLQLRSEIDVTSLLKDVRTPTLVIHARN